MYRHVAVVAGRGKFPFDMLRYDCCFPKDGNDVANIDRSREDADYSESRLIKLVRYSKDKLQEPFTMGRWSSFLWACRIETLNEKV